MYRLVAADVRSPRDGAFIEIIGHYNPMTEPETFVADEEKVLKWLRYGAKPTDTALRLLSKAGVIDKFKPTVVKKTHVKKARAAKPRKTKTTSGTKTKSTAEESS
jgi:small subunit ribosomal protein S16